MSYTIVDFPRIGAAIRPGIGALAHWHIAHKFSLLEKKLVLTLTFVEPFITRKYSVLPVGT